MTGQITVTTAGTAVQGPDKEGLSFALKAHPNNTDTVWFGNNASDIDSSTGFPLNKGEGVILTISNLNRLWFDADVNGEKICWCRM